MMTFFKSNYFHSFHKKGSHRSCSWKLPPRLRRIDSRQNWEENASFFYYISKLLFLKNYTNCLSCTNFSSLRTRQSTTNNNIY